MGLTVDEGYAGLEALSGIPGRVGAAPIQNVGAYGQEVAQTVGWVRALDRSTRDVVLLGPDECGFGYRDSVFKRSDRYVVLAVAFAPRALPARRTGPLRRAGPPPRRRGRRAGAGGRRPGRRARAAPRQGDGAGPGDHDTWSAGSFFTNPLLGAGEAAALPAAAPRWPSRDGRVKTRPRG